MASGLKSAVPLSSFWSGKRVLVTGHTGFKGRWLSTWLESLGAEVLGLSLSTTQATFVQGLFPTNNDLDFDISSAEWRDSVTSFRPEIIFHLAAQALVSEGYKDPLDTFRTNVLGSAQVLDFACTNDFVHTLVMVTTDKVYKNDESATPRIESDLLEGSDPYSSSKVCMEFEIRSWPKAQHLEISTVRSGNVIGGGDISSHRLLPDLFRAWVANEEILLRNPNGIRPWLHVLESLGGYLEVAERNYKRTLMHSEYNFSPPLSEHATVKQIAELAVEVLPAKTGFKIESQENTWFKESGILLLDSSRSQSEFGWQAILTWEESILEILQWSQKYILGQNLRELMQQSINWYVKKIGERNQ